MERTLAANVVAPLLLVQGLLEPLRAVRGRVVAVSGGEYPLSVDLADLSQRRRFVPMSAYSHSKVVMMSTMWTLAERLAGAGVTVNVCYRGARRPR